MPSATSVVVARVQHLIVPYKPVWASSNRQSREGLVTLIRNRIEQEQPGSGISDFLIRQFLCSSIRKAGERQTEKAALRELAGDSTWRLLALDSSNEDDDAYQSDEDSVDEESDVDSDENESGDADSDHGSGDLRNRSGKEKEKKHQSETDESEYLYGVEAEESGDEEDEESDEEDEDIKGKGKKRGKRGNIQKGKGKKGKGKEVVKKLEKRRRHVEASESESSDEEELRPQNPKAYKKKFSDFQVAQHLFKDEIDEYDRKQGRDPSERSSIGTRTKNARDWYRENCAENRKRLAQIRAAKEEWNRKGAPEAKQAEYRRRSMGKKVREFIELMERTMGVHCVMWLSHKSAEGGVDLCAMESEPKVRNTRFTRHALGKKVVRKMEDQLLEYMQKELEVESGSEDDTPSEAAKGEKARLQLDKNGFPVLPMLKDLSLSGRKSVIREIIRDAYRKFTANDRASVPWRLLSSSLQEYIDPQCLPEGVTSFPDPSKLQLSEVKRLWVVWGTRENQKLPKVVFLKCREGDVWENKEKPSKTTKRSKEKRYIEVSDEEESRGEGPSGTIQDDQISLPADPLSPVANSDTIASQLQFLRSLSTIQGYQDLISSLERVKASPYSDTPISLGEWCSWTSQSAFLPGDLHSDLIMQASLDQIVVALPHSGSRDRMILLGLGLGLLLRDIVRVVEQEPDQDIPPLAPHFINSPLTHRHLDRAVLVVDMAKNRVHQLAKGKKRASKVSAEPAPLSHSSNMATDSLIPSVDPSVLLPPVNDTALLASSEVVDDAIAVPPPVFDGSNAASAPEETHEMALLPTVETLSLGTTDNTTSDDIDQLQQGDGDLEAAEGEPAPTEMPMAQGKAEKKRRRASKEEDKSSSKKIRESTSNSPRPIPSPRPSTSQKLGRGKRSRVPTARAKGI